MDKYVFIAIKNLIDNRVKNELFTYEQLQGKTYIWTNESISEYLDLLNLNSKKNALTILGSGDQLFNLISKGIMEIDTIDVNRVAEYYALGLKKALIRKYDYNEFLDFWNNVNDSNTSIYNFTEILTAVIPYMDIKYRETWENIIGYNKLVNENNFESLFQIIGYNTNYDIKLIKEMNSYLKTEGNYNKVRNNIDDTLISFEEIDAIDLIHKKNKYDAIILSNVLDYFYKKWDTYTDKKIEQYAMDILKLLNDDGRVMFYYLFNDAVKMQLPKSIHNIYDIGNDEVVILKKTR